MTRPWRLAIGVLLVSATACAPRVPEDLRNPPPRPLGSGVLTPRPWRFVTEDVERFWTAVDARDSLGLARALETHYLRVGSAGLRAFDRSRIGGATRLAATVERAMPWYLAIRDASLALADQEAAVGQALDRATALVPGARPVNVYLVVGALRSAGTASGSGVILGAEFFAHGPDADSTTLSAWERRTVAGADRLPWVAVHEWCHVQQPPLRDHSLLSVSLREGTCDLLAELALGTPRQGAASAYGRTHERVLWAEFRQRMHSRDLRGFLYDGDLLADRPSDLGYFLGYRIASAYLARQPDTAAAIGRLLRLRDARRLLAESGYDP